MDRDGEWPPRLRQIAPSQADSHTQPSPTTGDITKQCHTAMRLLCELLLRIGREVAKAILAPLLHHLLEVHPQRKWACRALGEPPHASGSPEEPVPTHPSAGLVVEDKEEVEQEVKQEVKWEEEQEEDGDTLPRVEWEQEEGSKEALPCTEQKQGMEEDLPDDADEGRPQVMRRSRRRHGDGVGGYTFDSRG